MLPKPKSNEFIELERKAFARIFYAVLGIVFVILVGASFILYIHFWPAPVQVVETPPVVAPKPSVVGGMDVESGLIAQGDYLLVKSNCTSCHSGKLITQNRMNRDAWLASIRWMQETQNLGPLYDNEDPILDYLEKYYSPNKKGRRPRLPNIEWYELE